jgi:guanylate kinase
MGPVQCGQLYGTLRQSVEAATAAGQDVLLVIDVQEQPIIATPVWMRVRVCAPPSWEVLVERLRVRGSESASTQAQRLLFARSWRTTTYDYVVNDQLNDAAGTLQAIIVAERHRIRRVGTVPIAPLLAPQPTKG